ncbi:MAG: hypothetical protein HZA16_07175 [Nitrospirae bacterium]|nr:hypothetical protein [Nitrospirota bacterium]
MKDTHPDIKERFLRMIMEKTGEERLSMGFDMCETARRLVTASYLQVHPQASDNDIKVAIFERFYGKDLSFEIKEKIIKRIRKA